MHPRIPFRYRIGLLVVLAAIALLTVTTVTLILDRRAEHELTGIETRYVPLIELDRDLKTTFAQIPHTLQDAATSGEVSGLVAADALHDELRRRLRTGEPAIEDNGGDPAALEAELDLYYSRARAVAAQLVKGTPAANLAPQINEMVTAQQAFTARLDIAATPDRRRLASAFASARASQHTSLQIDIVVAISALVLMGAFSWWIIRGTVRSLKAVSTGVERLAHGDFSHEIVVESRDEIGELAREANRTAVRLREYREQADRQSWIETGLAELAAEIAGELDCVTLGKRTLAYLSRYVEAETATIYLRDGNVLDTIGAHRRSDGEPDDIRIDGNVVRVPFSYEGHALGTLELALAAPPDDRIEELLQRARIAIGIAFHVEESRQTTQRLLVSAESANKELETFSYSVSHDLRAPLRSIDGFSLAIAEDYGASLPAEGQDHLRRIRSGVQRMAELIDSLLALSRVSRGELNRKPTDLSGIAAEVVAEHRRTDPDRRVTVKIPPDVSAAADPKLVRVVLENLLGNAWKFTSKLAEASIEFGVEDRVIYFVRDNGAGFDMSYAGALFGPFQRLHADKDFPGTGIGLATVSRIVARHGGRIWVEAALDRGATFRFTLA